MSVSQVGDVIKRNYLALFFKDFKIKNGRITRFRLADELKPLISGASQLAYSSLIENGSVRVTPIGLPLVDVFTNREIEFDIQLPQIKTLYGSFGIPMFAN